MKGRPLGGGLNLFVGMHTLEMIGHGADGPLLPAHVTDCCRQQTQVISEARLLKLTLVAAPIGVMMP